MKNRNLQTDFENLQHERGYDSDTVQILADARDYIEDLEKKEERLLRMEEVLNTIADSEMPGKVAFLHEFREFLNA